MNDIPDFLKVLFSGGPIPGGDVPRGDESDIDAFEAAIDECREAFLRHRQSNYLNAPKRDLAANMCAGMKIALRDMERQSVKREDLTRLVICGLKLLSFPRKEKHDTPGRQI